MAKFLLNCLLLFIPIFIWNAVFYKKLPEFYQPAIWDNIAKPLVIAENILRYLSFSIPILFKINFDTCIQIIGLFLYFVGLLVYFTSWIFQINHKANTLSKNILFRMAPAYTTIIWLVGIGLIGKYSFISFLNIQVIYFPIIIAFVIVHTCHAFTIYKKTK